VIFWHFEQKMPSGYSRFLSHSRHAASSGNCSLNSIIENVPSEDSLRIGLFRLDLLISTYIPNACTYVKGILTRRAAGTAARATFTRADSTDSVARAALPAAPNKARRCGK
jgi:hypothetical protein